MIFRPDIMLLKELTRFFIALTLFSLIGMATRAQQPSFTAGGNVTVDQNSGVYSAPWASGINATTPVFDIVVLGYSGSMNSFTSGPTVDATGILSFEPVADRSGEATVKVTLRDLSNGELSIPATFKITINFINSAPSFTVTTPDQVIDEKEGPQTVLGWATNISAGPNPLEATQSISFKTTVIAKSAYMVFTQKPSIDPSGTLTYEVENTANGSATIEVYLEDNGSSINPNENTSAVMTFIITVNPINDKPSFNITDNVKVDEHTGMVTIPNWAINISPGPPDEQASQTVQFVLTQKSISSFLQFDIPVSIDASGTISFQATPHYNGIAVFEIYLEDDGPSTPPHNNKSSPLGFTVSVDFINDAPSFMIGQDIVVDEGDNTHAYPGWATAISPGDSPNEQDQNLAFSVVFQQVTGNLAFLRIPEIDTTGQLIFRPTEHTHGEAIFDVYLVDDGDFEPPNENQSPVQSFKITVTPVNYPPNDIYLSNTVIKEKLPVGTLVGELSASDQDPEDTHTFSLVMGQGSEGNDSFSIDGTNLVTAVEFDFETQNSLSIRVSTSDGEFSHEKNFTITIEKLIEGIKFPTAITPNGDGENDTWEIEDIEAYPDVTVFIYDRAGQSVFKSKQGYKPWDGTFNGTPLPMGTYYYVIDLHDGINVYKGAITIIR